MVKQEQNKKKSILEIIKKIIHYITTIIMYSVFLIMILVAIVFLMYFIDLKKNEATGKHEPPLFSAYVIISNSMDPTIKVQDAIVIKRVEGEEIKKGDVITFVSTDNRFYGITITHRVVGVIKMSDGKYMFRTKGDHNNIEDSTLVSEDYVTGKVILKIPKIGYIQYFLSQSYGWIVAIVIPCLGIVVYDVIKLIKLIAKNVNKTNNSTKEQRVRNIEPPIKQLENKNEDDPSWKGDE